MRISFGPTRTHHRRATLTHPTNRREFLQNSSERAALAVAVASLGGVHTFADESRRKLRVGLLGCGGQMRDHVQNSLASLKDEMTVDWLCDVDSRGLDYTGKLLSAYQTETPRITSNLEDVITDPRVDVCVIASPHHWHAPMALRAMQEGKDVYIEKPMSHVYSEGPRIVAAAKKLGRVVQHGSQMRSSPVTEKAGKLLADGIIGDIKVARAWTAETREEVKPVPDSAAPEGVDYDRWLGPAPVHAFNKHRFHFNWRFFREYGNGEIGDDGIHDLDMATWGLGVNSLPIKVTARGGRMMMPNHFSEFPDNMHAVYEYPDGRVLIYENYPFTEYGLHGYDNGNVFYGTEGYMVFSRRGAFNVYLGPKGKPGPTEGKELRSKQGYVEHMADFFKAVRERTSTVGNPEVANRSCALVHFGEIAYRTRGALEFDLQTEQFVDCDEANQLLTKSYRAPYGLPDIS